MNKEERILKLAKNNNRYITTEIVMKNAIKVLLILTSFLLVSTVNAFIDEELERNWRASELAGTISAIVGDNGDGYVESNTPSFYGGIYISDDHQLVVQIVKANIPKEGSKNYELYKKVIGYDVIVEYVRYSRAELTATREILEKKLQETNYWEYLYHTSDDTMNNRIEVGLRTLSDEEIARFKNTVMDSPMINFVQGFQAVATVGNVDDDIETEIYENSEVQIGDNAMNPMMYVAFGMAGLTVAGVIYFIIKKK